MTVRGFRSRSRSVILTPTPDKWCESEEMGSGRELRQCSTLPEWQQLHERQDSVTSRRDKSIFSLVALLVYIIVNGQVIIPSHNTESC